MATVNVMVMVMVVATATAGTTEARRGPGYLSGLWRSVAPVLRSG